jgi:hypothetical protein
MEIYYLNDEKTPITIQVNGQPKPHPEMPYGEANNEFFTLQPAEGRLFYVDAPEGSIPYVKRWTSPHLVLLTYLPAESIDQFRRI